MEQPNQNSADGAEANDAMPQMDPNAMAAFSHGFANQLSPEAMAGLMAGQPFMTDPSLGGMAGLGGMGHDPSLMMPFMTTNGHGAMPLQQQPDAHISADEIALYDRQIRLWGMAAQAKIQNANILLITMRALANEVAKNLVLAGVGSLTILDAAPVTEADLGAQFFLSEGDGVVGQNRAQVASVALRKLNPRVQVHVDTEGVKSKGPSYFGGFDVVVATDLDPDSFNLINTATRLNGRAFYAAGSHGMFGFIFSDLIEHDYVIERDLGNVATQPKQETRTRSIVDVKTKTEGAKTIESVTKRELYSTWLLASDIAGLPSDFKDSRRRLRNVSPALSCLRALWGFMQVQGGLPSNRDDLKLFTQMATQKHKQLGLPSETLRPEFLRAFLQNLGSEIAPVTAILGGQLAQDVINVLGQTQQPIQNMVIFDGTTMEALMYPLHPDGVLGAGMLTFGLGNDMNGNGGDGMGMDPSMAGMGGMGMGGMGGMAAMGDISGMGNLTGLPMDPSSMGHMPQPSLMPMGSMSLNPAPPHGGQSANGTQQAQTQPAANETPNTSQAANNTEQNKTE